VVEPTPVLTPASVKVEDLEMLKPLSDISLLFNPIVAVTIAILFLYDAVKFSPS
jgi:hypothetical protein